MRNQNTVDSVNRSAILIALRNLTDAQAKLHNLLTYADTSIDDEISQKANLIGNAMDSARVAVSWIEQVRLLPYVRNDIDV